MSGAADVFSSLGGLKSSPAYWTLAKDACKTKPHGLRLVPNCRACIRPGLVGTRYAEFYRRQLTPPVLSGPCSIGRAEHRNPARRVAFAAPEAGAAEFFLVGMNNPAHMLVQWHDSVL